MFETSTNAVSDDLTTSDSNRVETSKTTSSSSRCKLLNVDGHDLSSCAHSEAHHEPTWNERPLGMS